MSPAPSVLHILASWQIVQAGHAEEGCEELKRVGAVLGDSPWGAWAFFLRHAREGDAERALAVLTPEVAEILRRNEFTARTVGQGYALLGRTGDALPWLAVAVTGGFINYPHLAKHDPLLAGIREDPGFRNLMNEVERRWDAVVAWEAGLSLPAGAEPVTTRRK